MIFRSLAVHSLRQHRFQTIIFLKICSPDAKICYLYTSVNLPQNHSLVTLFYLFAYLFVFLQKIILNIYFSELLFWRSALRIQACEISGCDSISQMQTTWGYIQLRYEMLSSPWHSWTDSFQHLSAVGLSDSVWISRHMPGWIRSEILCSTDLILK